MSREPSRLEGLRTFPFDKMANTLAKRAMASRMTLLAIAGSLIIGVGLGFSFNSAPNPLGAGDRAIDRSVAPVAAAKTPSVAAGRDAIAAAYALADYPLSAQPLSDDTSGASQNRSSDSSADPAHDVGSVVAIDTLPVHEPEELHSFAFAPELGAEFGPEFGPEHAPAAIGPSASANPSMTDSRSLTLVTRGKIQRGESLGSSLGRQGISAATVHLIAAEMKGTFDFRDSRPGDSYRLGQDPDGRVLDFRYTQTPEESYYLAWEGTRYTARKETAELHAQIAKIAGVVDSSLYGAIVGLGEQSALASEFVRIFAWDIDFSRQVHPGDEFSILYERLYRRGADGQEVYVRPGKILAGRYAGKAGPHTVVYFEDDEDHGAYFRPDGSSIERAFLAAPLEFSRISSRFTRARRHPILNVTRPHPGIDYAAPHGTPIYAVAEGVVEYKARAGASGNLIRIRHAGGYTSHYAHLSRFQKSLSVGDRVEQRQVIGYVGSSGLSTGPHVCFRVKKDGQYVDPMKISSPAGTPIERERLDDFQVVRDQLLASLGPAPMSLVDDAL